MSARLLVPAACFRVSCAKAFHTCGPKFARKGTDDIKAELEYQKRITQGNGRDYKGLSKEEKELEVKKLKQDGAARGGPKYVPELIEHRIHQNMQSGDMEANPYFGKPLPNEEIPPFIPLEEHFAYKTLQRNGGLPEWVEYNKLVRQKLAESAQQLCKAHDEYTQIKAEIEGKQRVSANPSNSPRTSSPLSSANPSFAFWLYRLFSPLDPSTSPSSSPAAVTSPTFSARDVDRLAHLEKFWNEALQTHAEQVAAVNELIHKHNATAPSTRQIFLVDADERVRAVIKSTTTEHHV